MASHTTREDTGNGISLRTFEIAFSLILQPFSAILYWIGYGFLIAKEEDGGYGDKIAPINASAARWWAASSPSLTFSSSSSRFAEPRRIPVCQ